jgi:hypothetical protein
VLQIARVRSMRAWLLAGGLIAALALSSCARPPSPAVDVTQGPKGVQSSFSDSGSSIDQAAVRASLVDALTAQEDQLARTDQGAPRQSSSARSARLTTVESARLAQSDLEAMTYLTASDIPFRSARFRVTNWQGVAVHGDKAKAYALGHNTYRHWDRSSSSDAELQYKALLTRDPHAPHGWILTTYRAASNDQG